jgi:tetratricopeptide (TPR) repeat protein
MKGLCDLSPESPDLKFNMFAKLQEQGFDDAAAKFCQDTTAPAEVMKHYNNSGVLKSKEGTPDAAIKEYLSAIKFFPKYKENSRIYFNLAIAYVNGKKDGWLDKAVHALDEALALDPTYDKAKSLRDKLKPTAPAKKSA